MSDKETGAVKAGPNKTVLALMGVVIALLVVIVAIVVLQKPAATVSPVAATGSTGAAAMGDTATGAMPSQPATDVVFDMKTATKVTAGKTPEYHVKSYFGAVVSGDNAAA